MPRQVRGFDDVAVADNHLAQAGGHQVGQHGAAQAAGADHQRTRRAQARLPRFTDFRQLDLSPVAIVGR